MSVISNDFRELLADYGPMRDTHRIDANERSRLTGRLPEALLELWTKVGAGVWLDGRFQFCNPAAFDPLIGKLFAGDPDFSPQQCAAYGYTAFGRLLVWHSRFQALVVNFPLGHVTAPGFPDPSGQSDDGAVATVVIARADGAAADQVDEAGKPLFDRALKSLGPLASGDVYGFVPALSLGGDLSLKGLRRVRALEHFTILAQSQTFELVEPRAGNLVELRGIG